MAAGATYEPIATTTLGSVQSTVTFTSISGSYTDLVVIGNLGIDSNRYPFIRFNSDTGNNYSTTDVYGTSSSAASSRESNGSKIWISLDIPSSSQIESNFIVNVQNYSNSTTYKTALSRFNSAANGTTATIGLWRNTAAITSITIVGFGAGVEWNFPIGSTFTLYGIAAA
jgi:hypothetical protein